MVRIEKVIKPIHLFLKLKKFFGDMLVISPAMDFDKIAALKFLPGSNINTHSIDRKNRVRTKIVASGSHSYTYCLNADPGATQKYLLMFNIHSSQQAVL